MEEGLDAEQLCTLTYSILTVLNRKTEYLNSKPDTLYMGKKKKECGLLVTKNRRTKTSSNNGVQPSRTKKTRTSSLHERT
jgi:hypothetical protein